MYFIKLFFRYMRNVHEFLTVEHFVHGFTRSQRVIYGQFMDFDGGNDF